MCEKQWFYDSFFTTLDSIDLPFFNLKISLSNIYDDVDF